MQDIRQYLDGKGHPEVEDPVRHRCLRGGHHRHPHVESPLDVAVLATAGLKGGLSSFGAGDRPRQRALLSDRASQIVLALDNDDAGREAQAKLVAKLRGKEVFEFNYGTSEAKDIGEMDKDEIYDGLRYATRATGRSW